MTSTLHERVEVSNYRKRVLFGIFSLFFAVKKILLNVSF